MKLINKLIKTKTSFNFIENISTNEIFSIVPKLEEKGFRIFELNLKKIKYKGELFEYISKKLKFPKYFGNNWDSLDECMSDLSWHNKKGYIFIINNGNDLKNRDLNTFNTFLDILVSAGSIFENEKIPFHIIFIGKEKFFNEN